MVTKVLLTLMIVVMILLGSYGFWVYHRLLDCGGCPDIGGVAAACDRPPPGCLTSAIPPYR